MTEKKNKGGRPSIQNRIDKKNFENLCGMFCTREEISYFFDVSHDTLERWCKKTYKAPFKECFERFRCRGYASLRRTQRQLAEKNAGMAIFLGKQYLGQKDEQTVNQNISPVVIKDDISES